jgi:glycerate-2-kinase
MDEFKALLRMNLPKDKICLDSMKASRDKLMQLGGKIKRLQEVTQHLSLKTKTDYVQHALRKRH